MAIKVKLSDVIKWIKSNAENEYYIGYYSNGNPYIDAKLLCKDMKRELTNKQQGYGRNT